MTRHTFIQMSKLTDLKGRISYISSPERQENLYATYSTCNDSFWKELAHTNQIDFRKSGSAGKCIEARELIISLPEYYVEFDPNEVLKTFSDFFKEKYGVECTAALHHNKTKTNYHIHLIFSERKLSERILEKIASRNMYFDENGKKTTKAMASDKDSGKLRAGCTVIKKGEVYDRQIFDKKDPHFKDKAFIAEIKEDYTELINDRSIQESDKLSVFDRNDIYIPTKKIGKHNPKEAEIKAINAAAQEWNMVVDKTLEYMPRENIMIVKQTQIAPAVARSIQSGKPNTFAKIITLAKQTLMNFTRNWLFMDKPSKDSNSFVRILNHSRAKERSRDDWER